MKQLNREGWRMAYEVGDGDHPPLILCHALGADRTMWDPLAEHLETERRLITFDHRGHGESAAPAAPYAMTELGGDVISLADHLGLQRFDFCGISMGGQVGLWVAIHHPQRVRRLALANTGAKIGTDTAWEERIATVRDGGMGSIAPAVVERFFSDRWRARHPEQTQAALEVLLSIDPEGYVGCCAAIRDADLTESVSSIQSPTLLIGGHHDVSTPPEAQEWLAANIPDADLKLLDAAHLSSVERPAEFASALRSFLRAD